MMQSFKKYFFKRSLIVKCLIASLALHLLLVYFFYKQPISVFTSSIFSKTKPQPLAIASEDNPLEEKDQILQEAIDDIIYLPKSSMTPFDFSSMTLSSNGAPKLEQIASINIGSSYTSIETPLFNQEISINDESFDLSDIYSEDVSPKNTGYLAFSQDKISIDPTITNQTANEIVAQYSYVESFSSVDEDISFAPSLVTSPSEESLKASKDLPFSSFDYEGLSAANDTQRLSTMLNEWGQKDLSVAFPYQIDKEVSFVDVPASYDAVTLSSIDESSIPKVSGAISWNDYFDVIPAISPPTEDAGYVFSIALNPKDFRASDRMSQNFYFILDPSTSLDKHKFSLFKMAVMKSLKVLQPGDKFNIVMLDKKLSKLSPKSILFNEKNMRLAEDFIESLNQTLLPTGGNLLGSLEKLSLMIDDTDQMHTALLLTNGLSSQNFKNQQASLKKFMEKNGNKLSIFAAAVGSKNNLVNLDMLCRITGGSLLYSDTNASFPRKFSNLVKTLRMPLAKEVRIKALTASNKSDLSLLTNPEYLPNLYANEPYVILGTMKRLSDIHIVLEAKHGDEWITVDKKISFQNADLDRTLLTEWVKAQVNGQYTGFLRDPKAKYIKRAKELLKTTHGRAIE